MKQEQEENEMESHKLEDAIIRGGKCLIIQLLTTHRYNRDAFKLMLKKIWRAIKNVRIRDLNSMLTLIDIEEIRDRNRVIRKGPWNFDKHFVLIKAVKGNQPIHLIRITEALF